mgnify:CR=1 FL=1
MSSCSELPSTYSITMAAPDSSRSKLCVRTMPGCEIELAARGGIGHPQLAAVPAVRGPAGAELRRAIARRAGANPARAILEVVGGQGPQRLVGELAGGNERLLFMGLWKETAIFALDIRAGDLGGPFDAVVARDVGAEGLVRAVLAPRLRQRLELDVGRLAPCRREVAQQQQLGHGIGTARERRDHARARTPQAMAIDVALDTVEERAAHARRLCAVAASRAHGFRWRRSGGDVPRLCRRCQPTGQPGQPSSSSEKAGAGGRTRTADPALMRRML